MNQQLVQSRATREYWLIIDQDDNGVTIKNFDGYTMREDWCTLNSTFDWM